MLFEARLISFTVRISNLRAIIENVSNTKTKFIYYVIKTCIIIYLRAIFYEINNN